MRSCIVVFICSVLYDVIHCVVVHQHSSTSIKNRPRTHITAKHYTRNNPIPVASVSAVEVNSNYSCIFGFSSGHVGTTSLGHAATYGNISRVGFVIFVGNCWLGTPNSDAIVSSALCKLPLSALLQCKFIDSIT